MKLINQWTYEDLQDFLKNPKISEDNRYEFKEFLNFQTDKQKEEVRKDFSAFANAEGGYIFVGVENSAYVIKGIEEDNEFRTKLSRILSNHANLSPSIKYSQINVITIPKLTPQKIVRVFEIKGSLEYDKPHVSDNKIYIREQGESKPVCSGEKVRRLFGGSKFHSQHIDQLEYNFDQLKKAQRWQEKIFDFLYFRYLEKFLEEQKELTPPLSEKSEIIIQLLSILKNINKLIKEINCLQKNERLIFESSSYEDSATRELIIGSLSKDIEDFICKFKKVFP